MSHHRATSRRRFLRQTAVLAAAGLAAPAAVPSRILGMQGKPGANEEIIIGFIGAGHRARLLMSQTPAPGRIVAICDVFFKRCGEAIQQLGDKAQGWRTYKNYHKLLEAKDIDAVIVPTPDHARVLVCIHACQAGKDIYAEKPLTLTIAEGRVLVRAVRKYKRVFQTGSQQRSMEYNRYACELVRTGRFGKLLSVQACNYPGPGNCEGLPEEPIPDTLNWDMWCAQTRLKPYNSRMHLGWMGCRDYSGGEMTNWGAHGLDQVQWALGASQTGPVEIWPVGDGPGAKVHMSYASGALVKLELSPGPLGGAVFHCEKGTLFVDRNRFKADPPELANDPPPPQKREMWEGPGWQAKFHIGNWLDCIKTREKPVADVEIGHRSITVCHLGNIVRQVGRKLFWDPENEVFIGDEEANTYLDRPKRKGYELPDPL